MVFTTKADREAGCPGLPPSSGTGDAGSRPRAGRRPSGHDHFSITTDTAKLFPADLPWRQAEARLAQAFPDREDLILVVLDGATQDLAERGTASLAAALQARPDLFRSVRRPDASPYFRHHALLYLPMAELRKTTERMIEAQPLLGTLAADPSARGLLNALDLMLRGVARGEVALASLAGPLGRLAESAEAAGGRASPFDWSACCSTASLRRGSCGASCWSARGSTSPPCRQAPPPGR